MSFPGFGGTCGGSSSGMAYLKSAPYPVPGLGLHGLPVDSLHSSMAYPGGNNGVSKIVFKTIGIRLVEQTSTNLSKFINDNNTIKL